MYEIDADIVSYENHNVKATLDVYLDNGEKHGYGGDSVLHPSGMNSDTLNWTLGGYKYYDSPIIYFAIGN